ncbi:hypothetical protein PoB_005166900, partial [Plakobranchus ocellatus]
MEQTGEQLIQVVPFDSNGARQGKLDLTWLQVLQIGHRKVHQWCCHFRISEDAFSKL